MKISGTVGGKMAIQLVTAERNALAKAVGIIKTLGTHAELLTAGGEVKEVATETVAVVKEAVDVLGKLDALIGKLSAVKAEVAASA